MRWPDCIITPTIGANGPVYVVATDITRNVYIGGAFTSVGGVTTGPAAVLRYGSTTWQALSGLNATNFASGAKVYAFTIDCNNLPNSLSTAPPCDVYVGGAFQLTAPSGSVATNLAKYDYSSKSWDVLAGHGMTYNSTVVYALAKKDFGVTSSTKKLWVGGDLGSSTYLKYYDSSKSQWSNVAGPNAPVRTVYYNPNLFSTDELYVGGSFNFTSGSVSCNLVCKLLISSTAWNAVGSSNQLGSGLVSSIGYYSGNVYVSGSITNKLMLLKANNKDWIQVSPTPTLPAATTTINSIDVCGTDDLGCKAGSVSTGGDGSLLKFFNNYDGSWTDFSGSSLSNGNSTFIVNSVVSQYVISHASVVSFSSVIVMIALIVSLMFVF